MTHLLRLLLFQNLFLFAVTSRSGALPVAGFSIPDSLHAVTLRFRTAGNLILLPVTINDTIQVNLVLDTGCRNLVLFGRRFTKLFRQHPTKLIQFSGLGNGTPVTGGLSLDNKVSINAVLGKKIPVVIVKDQNLFEDYRQVDGVIGYDIFIRFEVELDLARQLITFRPASTANISPEYEKIPIRIEDSRPIIRSVIFFPGREGQPCDLMIDTGSSLGLLLKTTDLNKYLPEGPTAVLGRGFNGDLEGSEAQADKLLLAHYEMNKLPAGIVYSPWHNYASIGMEVMKHYSIVLNYCKAYVGFKKA